MHNDPIKLREISVNEERSIFAVLGTRGLSLFPAQFLPQMSYMCSEAYLHHSPETMPIQSQYNGRAPPSFRVASAFMVSLACITIRAPTCVRMPAQWVKTKSKQTRKTPHLPSSRQRHSTPEIHDSAQSTTSTTKR